MVTKYPTMILHCKNSKILLFFMIKQSEQTLRDVNALRLLDAYKNTWYNYSFISSSHIQAIFNYVAGSSIMYPRCSLFYPSVQLKWSSRLSLLSFLITAASFFLPLTDANVAYNHSEHCCRNHFPKPLLWPYQSSLFSCSLLIL